MYINKNLGGGNTVIRNISLDAVHNSVYENISAILLRALPALNQPICVSFMVWSSRISSALPSECFKTHLTGWPKEERERHNNDTA